MSETSNRAKIEIRLELRQLVLLSLGTMTFSGTLFAVGYWLGTRDGLQSVTSSNASVLKTVVDDEQQTRVEIRPTKAALGEVEFLFAQPNKKLSRTPRTMTAEARARSLDESRRRIETSTQKRKKIPKLKPRTMKAKADTGSVALALPKLPAIPVGLNAKTDEPGGLSNKQAIRVEVLPERTRSKVRVAAKTKPVGAAKPVASPSANAAQADASLKKAASTPKTRAKTRLVKAKAERAQSASRGVAAAPVEPIAVRSTQRAKPAKAEPAKASRNATKTAGPYFTVQIKAVTDQSEAERFSQTLRSKGFEPNVVLANIPQKGRYYRIRVGKFSTLDEARRFQKELSARRLSSDRGFVTRY